MCGIVGYIGKREAYPILIKGLKRLEYRGYDSAGVALISNSGDLNVYKAKGKVSDLERSTEAKDVSGHIGIAHTRWATHGEPCAENAHPHYSASGNLALIHNGIIENYATLKERLQQRGVKFRSQTDSEVLVQLIEYIQVSNDLDLLGAVQVALHEVIGAYAIAILDKRHPEQIIAARKSSPLVVGIGRDNEFYLASDATPIVEYTDKVVYLEDGDIAVIRPGDELKVVDMDNTRMHPTVKTVDINLGQLEKGGYPYFMLKEIFEQPDCLLDCMRGRINIDADNVTLSAVIDHKDKLLSASRFIIVACGTSWHAGLIGQQLIENYCRIPVYVEYASEFRYRNPVILPTDVVIAISQSGETADTLAAIELARKQGAFVFGICNSVGASIPRATHTGAYIHVGPEIGVASTKAFTGQVTVLAMLTLALAKARGTISQDEYVKMMRELVAIPEKMKEALQANEQIAQMAKIFTYAHNCLYLGRGYCYPVALEGALKLKEISYIHSEAYAAGELKHGTISLVEPGTLVVALCTYGPLREKMVSNIREVKARGAIVLALAEEGQPQVAEAADHVVWLPKADPLLAPSLAVIPLQLFAYYVALLKGCDIDKPRNLAKSVTVE